MGLLADFNSDFADEHLEIESVNSSCFADGWPSVCYGGLASWEQKLSSEASSSEDWGHQEVGQLHLLQEFSPAE